MSPIQAAARADQEQIWPGSLRISEVAEARSDSSKQFEGTTHTAMLHSTVGHLLAGWRWLESKRTQQLASRRLRLAETISLGEKRSVSIVQVDGAQYLIGCSPNSVQLLAVLDKQNPGTSQLIDDERIS